MSNYVTLAELKALKDSTGQPYDLSAFTDPELQAMLDMAEDTLHLITNNRFGPYEETWNLDGVMDEGLNLPPAIPYKLLSIDSLLLLDQNGDTVDELVENTDFVNRGHMLVRYRGEEYNPRREVSPDVWSSSMVRYQLAGRFGMEETPEQIKRVVMFMAINELMPGTISWLTSGDVQSFRLGDYAVTYRNVASVGGTSSSGPTNSATGYPTLDRMIRPYVLYSDLFMNSTNFAYLVESTYAG